MLNVASDMLGSYLEVGEYAFDMAVVILGVRSPLDSYPFEAHSAWLQRSDSFERKR